MTEHSSPWSTCPACHPVADNEDERAIRFWHNKEMEADIPASGITPDGRDLFLEQMEAMQARRQHKPLGHRCAEPDCVLPIDHPAAPVGDDAMTFTKHHSFDPPPDAGPDHCPDCDVLRWLLAESRWQTEQAHDDGWWDGRSDGWWDGWCDAKEDA